jgi:2-keto-4-pentenoate hydratase/2-oxohepta-3-ene-1,7-dioic acid hydratase in catechol pathway
MTTWVRFKLDERIQFGALQPDDRIVIHRGDLFGNPKPDGPTVSLEEVMLLPPLEPRSIIGLWNNYHQLAEKLGSAIPKHPLYFFKNVGAVIGPEAKIESAASVGRVAYEGELAVIVGRRIRDATPEEAVSAIFGYTCINDVSALDLLSADPSFPQWARAKSCDSFAPLGPVIVTDLDIGQARLRTSVNGRERQNYPLSDMIFDPPTILRLLSSEMTLHPGDVIACGTSVGSLPMRPDTTVEISIDGIGVLRNQYIQRKDGDGGE